MSNDFRQTVKDARNLTTSIRKLSEAMRGIQELGLSDRALLVLAADSAGISKRQAERVIKGFSKLEKCI